MVHRSGIPCSFEKLAGQAIWNFFSYSRLAVKTETQASLNTWAAKLIDISQLPIPKWGTSQIQVYVKNLLLTNQGDTLPSNLHLSLH
jgi:hypothetical protein